MPVEFYSSLPYGFHSSFRFIVWSESLMRWKPLYWIMVPRYLKLSTVLYLLFDRVHDFWSRLDVCHKFRFLKRALPTSLHSHSSEDID